jgi:hypothetical protein
MNNVRPLPVYPHKPSGAILGLLKEAKAKLGIDILIQPVDAVIGSPGRILCLGEKLPWIQDHAIVKNMTVDSMAAALAYVLELNDDPRGVTVLRQLKEIFGEDTREVTS